jgi:hypothetical protein
MSFKIIDNYLNIDEFLILKTIMESDSFPWFYNEIKVAKDKNLFHYQFCHNFYINDEVNSSYFNNLKPLINKLKPLSLIRIKANLNPVSHKLVEFTPHQDQKFKCKIALFYLNNNNGYTIIDKEKINSKENRMVLFNSDVAHYGTNSTDCKNRMVINFNYF